MRDGMVHAEAFQPRLRLLRQRVVCGAHIRELGVGRHRRHHEGGEHGIAPARVLERGVGVPEAVAERVKAPAAVRFHHLPVRFDIRDVRERLVAETVLLQDAEAGLAVELAVEPGGEIELLGARERLVPEHEHGMFVHGRADALEGLLVMRAAEIDRARLGGEMRVKPAEPECHGWLPRCEVDCGPVSMGRPGSGAQSPIEPS